MTRLLGNLLCQQTSLESCGPTEGWDIWWTCPSQPRGSDGLRSIGSDFSGLKSDVDEHP